MYLFLICLSLFTPGDASTTMNETATISKHLLLKASYRAVEHTDPEYGQGAIERNELAHREIIPMVWLIEIPAPAEPAEWQKRLNESVDPSHGSFGVTRPTAEEQRKVDCGEITLQR